MKARTKNSNERHRIKKAMVLIMGLWCMTMGAMAATGGSYEVITGNDTLYSSMGMASANVSSTLNVSNLSMFGVMGSGQSTGGSLLGGFGLWAFKTDLASPNKITALHFSKIDNHVVLNWIAPTDNENFQNYTQGTRMTGTLPADLRYNIYQSEDAVFTDSEIIKTLHQGTTFSIGSWTSAEGKYVMVQTVDGDGYAANSSALMINSQSSITSVSPSLNGYVSGNITVTGWVSTNMTLSAWTLTLKSNGITVATLNTGTTTVNGTLTSNWNTTTVADGWYDLTLSGTDISGNYTSASTVLGIVNTRPAANIIGAAPSLNGTVSQSISILGNVTLGFGLSTWVLKDGSKTLASGTTTVNGILTSNWNTMGETDGVHTLILTAVNGAGGVTTTSIVITINNPIKVVIESVTPILNGYVSGNITISGLVMSSVTMNPWSLWVSGNNNSVWTLITSNNVAVNHAALTSNWNTGSLSDGVYTFVLSASDVSGNAVTVSSQVSINNTNAVVTIHSITPISNGVVNGIATIQGTVTLPFGLKTWRLGTASKTLAEGTTPISNGVLTGNWDTRQENNGTYNILLTAVNFAGAVSSTSMNITINNTAPVVTIANTRALTSNILLQPIRVSSTKAMSSVVAYDHGLMIYEKQNMGGSLTETINVVLNTLAGAADVTVMVIDTDGNRGTSNALRYFMVPQTQTIGSGIDGITFNIEIPVGALTMNVVMNVSADLIALHSTGNIPATENNYILTLDKFLHGVDITMTPTGVDAGRPTPSLSGYITISMTVTPNLTRPDRIRVYYFDPIQLKWTTQWVSPVSVTTPNRVTFLVNHLSYFGIVSVLTSNSVPVTSNVFFDNVMSAPNPLKKGDIAHIGYALNQAANVKLYIHSMNGDLLYSDSKDHAQGGRGANYQFQWNVKDKWNEDVANGVYFAYLIAKGNGVEQKRIVKIAVIR